MFNNDFSTKSTSINNCIFRRLNYLDKLKKVLKNISSIEKRKKKRKNSKIVDNDKHTSNKNNKEYNDKKILGIQPNFLVNPSFISYYI